MDLYYWPPNVIPVHPNGVPRVSLEAFPWRSPKLPCFLRSWPLITSPPSNGLRHPYSSPAGALTRRRIETAHRRFSQSALTFRGGVRRSSHSDRLRRGIRQFDSFFWWVPNNGAHAVAPLAAAAAALVAASACSKQPRRSLPCTCAILFLNALN